MGADWLCPQALFDGQQVRRDLALRIAAGHVAEVAARADVPAGMGRVMDGVLAPGFVDLQVNGGGGVLLNNDPSPEAMVAIAAAHRRFGTVGILPTVITDAPEVLARAVAAALEAKGSSGVLGLHIEGPHLSLARRGTHAARFVRPFETATMAHVERLRAAGVAVMITVAPEAVSDAQILDLAATGAVVSLGHTDTDADKARAALAAGARCFTHLFNAMSPMLNRAAGVTGAAINSGAYCGVICDGIHVADEMVLLAHRARPVAGRMFLISDAMATVGGPDHFTLYGQTIRLQDGRLVNDEGSLAGAHITMAASVARLVRLGLALEEALLMAVTVPAAVMQLKRPLVGLAVADLVRLGPDGAFVGDCAGLM